MIINRRTLLAGGAAGAGAVLLGSGPARARATEPSTPVWVERSAGSNQDPILYIWAKTPGGQWIRHYLRRFKDLTRNLDAWRVNGIAAVPQDGDPAPGEPATKTMIVQPGNLEYAFQTAAAPSPDVGGLHGNELLVTQGVIVAGTEVDLAQLPLGATVPSGTRFELRQHNRFYDPAAPTAALADLCVGHVITPTGLEITWTLTWTAPVSLKNAFGAMLPANRDATTELRFAGQSEVIPIVEVPPEPPHANVYGASLSGPPGTVSVTVEPGFFDAFQHSGDHGCWLSVRPGQYNKLYPTRIHNTAVAIGPGTTWDLTARYGFDYPVAP